MIRKVETWTKWAENESSEASMNVTQRINVNFVSKHSLILRRNFREPFLRSVQLEPLALKVLRVGVRFTFILVVTIGAKKLFLSSRSWTVVTPNSVISVPEVSPLLGACQTFGATLTFLPQLICIITAFTNQTQIQSIFDYSKRLNSRQRQQRQQRQKLKTMVQNMMK